jgi:DNA replication protein DnaC
MVEGSYLKLMAQISTVDLLLIDDWGLEDNTALLHL